MTPEAGSRTRTRALPGYAACAAAGLQVIEQGWSPARLDTLMRGALGLVATAPVPAAADIPGAAR
jgi:hypothetical protein